ncbi:hypothetical protein YC2023_033724 [Brassica napus]
MHFMLEDFPRSLLPKVTLENFSEDSWKTLGRLLGKSSNAFYARRRSTKSSKSLPKFEYAYFFQI